MSDTPAAFFRNAIDLNRYSNSVAKQIILRYNDIIINAVQQLERTIPRADGSAVTAPATQARLRALLAQLKESLDGWAGDATAITAGELQGLALLQTEFVADQLRKALPPEGRSLVRTVEISPQFAQSVVTTDPTQLNVVALSDDLFKSVYGAEALATQAGTGLFNLTAAKGATITLPNGQVVEKAFRGLATSQAERFSNVVRNGLLSGEPTPSIARRLIGNLDFGQEARSVRELAQAGGELTKMANSQVTAIVRTSINQVANAASNNFYEANQDITKKYRYVATLDSRTSAICRALDGREFAYGQGPRPPQHFNCLPGDALVAPRGRIAAVYRRRYEGFLYVIKTADGHVVRATPNHPILTSAGWQPAQGIKVGDQVFSRSIIPGELIEDCQECDAAATAEDVFGAFRKSVTVFSVEVPTTAPDFHGDAWSGGPRVNLAKQVAVVLADRELLLAVNPSLLKTLHNRSFEWTNFAAAASSHFDLSGLTVGASAFGSMSSSGKSLAFSGGSTTHPSELLLASVSELAPGIQNDPLYGTWRDVELLSNAANTNAIVIGCNDQVNVTWIGREPFSGHVYNFETESGTYWADGILTHNCRSTTVPVIDYKGLGFTPPPEGKRAAAGGMVPSGTTYGEWLSKQPAAVQADVLGPSKVPYFEMLSRKHGPQQAITRMVSEDGSELTLKQLQRRYGTQTN